MSSVREQGEILRERDERAQREREKWRYDEALALVSRWFYGDFYAHHFVPNPDYNPRVFAPLSNPRRIVDPDRPLPEIRFFSLAAHDVHADASFECEGVDYVCRWEFHSGGDRAYWDDGWWPRWFVVQRERRFLRRDRVLETQVYGPAQVAELLA